MALRLAAMAAPVALEYFERGVQSWSKADGTVVGEADLAVDKLIAAELAKVRPGDGVLSDPIPRVVRELLSSWDC